MVGHRDDDRGTAHNELVKTSARREAVHKIQSLICFPCTQSWDEDGEASRIAGDLDEHEDEERMYASGSCASDSDPGVHADICVLCILSDSCICAFMRLAATFVSVFMYEYTYACMHVCINRCSNTCLQTHVSKHMSASHTKRPTYIHECICYFT
jgi:hypothetical protein